MKKLFQISKFAILSLFTVAIVSCDNGDEITPIQNPTGPTKNIVQLAQGNPDLSRLVEAVTQAGLGSILSGSGTFTVFAPTNAAFDAEGITSAYITNQTTVAQKEVLKQILLNHVFGTVKTATDLTTGYYKTLGFGTASTTNSLSMYVNNSVPTGGGTVVTINGGLLNDGAVVSSANNAATNGIVHIVNGVILPPKIVNHAVANSNFSTLVTVLSSTGGTFGNQAPVLAALGTDGPLTVFAPTNAAFTAATFITGASSANVTKVLQYHVASGNVLSTMLMPNQVIATLLTPPTQNLTVDLSTPNAPKLSDSTSIKANIIATNVQCANGVIHAVDKVLQPTL